MSPAIGPLVADGGPEVWGITPDTWPPEDTLHQVVGAFRDGLSRVIVRERRLSIPAQHDLVRRLLAAGLHPEQVLLRVGRSDPSPPSGWSVHLAEGAERPPGNRPLVSAAVHAPTALRRDVDALLVSPFASPRSKADTRPALGTAGLAPFLGTPAAVIALGGITPENAPRALRAGAAGVAAISAVFGSDEAERRRLLAAVSGPMPHR